MPVSFYSPITGKKSFPKPYALMSSILFSNIFYFKSWTYLKDNELKAFVVNQNVIKDDHYPQL